MKQPAKPTVLVVDDDQQMLAGVRRTLGELDCAVRTAADGASALQEATGEGPVDLLILDRMLPDADGVELLGHLRAQGVCAPAIVITAHPSLETAVSALGLRAVHYLAKPFAPDELVAAAREALGGGSGRRPMRPATVAGARRPRFGVMSRTVCSSPMAAASRNTPAPVLIEGNGHWHDSWRRST